ncbi:MAG TPA: hypothetical protein VFJ16_29300 [Longimicrobium sp.]|nr:hypothetical protein [Longimicrobium sp.]
MSRSFHATHAAAARLGREDFANAGEKERRLGHIRADLRQKRATKRVTRCIRRRHGHAPTPVDAIPVRRTDRSPFLHFPADADDTREILRRLPRGVTDGLAGVTLSLGMEASEAADGLDAVESPRDPFTGRPSSKRFPGVWSGRVMGRYRPWSASVELYGYAFDAADPHRPVWMPLLRAEALATLAHEVAHHHDHTARVARGRWIAAHREAVERYAEGMQHRWTREIIIPYLRERYADEIRGLERWVERNGGIHLPFEALVDDPRVTGRGGSINATRAIWSMRQAVGTVLESMGQGDPAWKTRLLFAREIHYLDRFGDALRVIDGVLRERPREREARLDRADVLAHLDRHQEALVLARELVAEDESCEEARRLVMGSAGRLGRWSEAIGAATWQVERVKRERAKGLSGALLDRAWLRARSGDVAGARADVSAAEAAGRVHHWRAERARRAIEAAETGVEPPPRRELGPLRGWWPDTTGR